MSGTVLRVYMCFIVEWVSHVPLFATPWTAACQASLSFIVTQSWLKLMFIEEKAMAPHSSTLAWRIPGMGDPGGLPSLGSHRVRNDWSKLAAAAAACSLSQWCLPTVLSSTIPSSFCLQSFPASESFPVSRLFASGGQSSEASATDLQNI